MAEQSSQATRSVAQERVEDLPENRVREVGQWSEQFSSSGKRYFYNRETEVSQWEKPPEWVDAERRFEDDCKRREADSKRVMEEQSRERERRDSEQANASSNDSMDICTDEEEDIEVFQQYEEGLEWQRYYNPDIIPEWTRKVFNEEVPKEEDIEIFKEIMLADMKFHFDEMQLKDALYKARSLRLTSLARAQFHATKAKNLKQLQEKMEKIRIHFQQKFDEEMPKLLEKCKPSEHDEPLISVIPKKEEKPKSHHQREREYRQRHREQGRSSSSKHPTPSKHHSQQVHRPSSSSREKPRHHHSASSSHRRPI